MILVHEIFFYPEKILVVRLFWNRGQYIAVVLPYFENRIMITHGEKAAMAKQIISYCVWISNIETALVLCCKRAHLYYGQDRTMIKEFQFISHRLYFVSWFHR